MTCHAQTPRLHGTGKEPLPVHISPVPNPFEVTP